jgi:hypothetical protein
MSSQLAVLNILPVNKTVVFYSPIEGKDVLVRTGTIADGSCFFHTLLHAYSKDYVSMDSNGRMKFVKKLRSSISRKIDKSRWENLSNGLIAKVPFQENVNNILTNFYQYINKENSGKTKNTRKVIRKVIVDEKSDFEAYKLITEMISLDDFEKNILPSAYEKCIENTVRECKKTIVNYAIKYYNKEFDKLKNQLDDNSIKFYIDKLEKLVQEIVDVSEDSSYTEYIESLQDSSMDIDTYTIGLISEKFNRDIYFIDSRTRMPYRDASIDKIKKRKSIIVMWTGGCHYEIVGRLLPGNRIQREFDHTDSLIKRIYTYLCTPEQVPDQYPNLVPYLPKDLRKKIGLSLSDSEHSQRSDSDYDHSERSQRSDSDYDHSERSQRSNSDYDHNERSQRSQSDNEHSHRSKRSNSDNEHSHRSKRSHSDNEHSHRSKRSHSDNEHSHRSKRSNSDNEHSHRSERSNSDNEHSHRSERSHSNQE